MQQVLEIQIHGLVQGVGFRWFTYKKAIELGLVGIVRNLPDGGVYIEAQGRQEILQDFVSAIEEGPTFARVKDVQVQVSEGRIQFSDFSIQP